MPEHKVIPEVETLEGKSPNELQEIIREWGPIYSKRFELEDIEEYTAISIFFISCSMMLENLNNGWRRWWRITVPVTESRWEESVS